MNLPFLRERKDGIRITVHAQPRASKSEITGLHGDALKVRIAAQPVDGEANAELIRLFSDVLGIPKKSVTLEVGGQSKHKIVEISGISAAQFTESLRKLGVIP